MLVSAKVAPYCIAMACVLVGGGGMYSSRHQDPKHNPHREFPSWIVTPNDELPSRAHGCCQVFTICRCLRFNIVPLHRAKLCRLRAERR